MKTGCKTMLGIAGAALFAVTFGGAKLRAQPPASSARQTSALVEIPFFGVFARARENSRRASCASNLKQIALGMLQYTSDYDEKLPPANKWNDVITTYTRSEEIYHCPEVPNSKYGYAMNWRLSRKSLGDVKNPAGTATFYDSRTLKRNAVGSGGIDISFRHMNGANFACADGHVKWSNPQNVPSFLLHPAAPPKTKSAPRRAPQR